MLSRFFAWSNDPWLELGSLSVWNLSEITGEPSVEVVWRFVIMNSTGLPWDRIGSARDGSGRGDGNRFLVRAKKQLAGRFEVELNFED